MLFTKKIEELLDIKYNSGRRAGVLEVVNLIKPLMNELNTVEDKIKFSEYMQKVCDLGINIPLTND